MKQYLKDKLKQETLVFSAYNLLFVFDEFFLLLGSIVSQLLNLMREMLKDYVQRFVGPTKLCLGDLF